jgi:hypothetical protein
MRSWCARAQVPGNSLVRLPGRWVGGEIGWGRGRDCRAVDTTRSDAGFRAFPDDQESAWKDPPGR